jgi:hypothetical protein
MDKLAEKPPQCCQPAEISAAKHKSGPRKISAAEKIRGRIFCRITEKWQKRARTLKVCFSLKILDNLQN